MITALSALSVNLPAISLTDDCFLIDNSSLERITTCPRAAEYYILQKRERNRDRSALKFGRIIHKILETRALLLDGACTQAVEDAMLAVAAKEFENYIPPEDDHRNYNTAIQLIREYNKAYPSEPYSIHRDRNGKPLVEVGFSCPLGTLTVNSVLRVRNPDGSVTLRFVGTINIIWTGRIDEIVDREGRLYIRDHKTTSMLGGQYFKDFELSSQMLGYTWAASDLLQQQVAGVIINALGLRKPTKTGKALEFQRQVYSYSPEQIEEWKRDTLTHIANFVSQHAEGFHPKATKWCMGKYGACEFWEVCTLPSNDRQTMLSTAEYKDVKWNPLNPDAE